VKRPPPLWAQLLALSALSDRRFVPVAIALLFGILALRAALEPFGDQDALWVAAAGRDMLATGAVPHTNAWAIADASVPWVMHEWALGPIYAWLVTWLGLAGPVVLGIAGAAFTTILLARGTIGASRHLAAGALCCLLAVATIRECLFQPRPAYVLLGLPLVAIELGLRERFERRHAALFVLLVLVWTNVHGSFPLALVILAVGAVTHTADRRLRLITLGASTLATLLNPYGLALHGLVDRYLRGADESAALIHAHIAEFQPLWSAGPVFGSAFRVVPIVVIVVAGIIGAIRSDRAVRGRIALALGMCALAILHARHVPQAIAISAVLLVPLADRLVDHANVGASTTSGVSRALAVGVSGAAILSAVIASRGVVLDDALGGPALPALAADARARGRATYVPFDAAGAFVWYALPYGSRVFFDPRNDCYGADTILAAVQMEEADCVGTCAVDALVERGVEVAIVREAHPTFDGLAESDAFVAARTIDDWTLFVRADARGEDR
jgi:hypothetical protein